MRSTLDSLYIPTKFGEDGLKSTELPTVIRNVAAIWKLGDCVSRHKCYVLYAIRNNPTLFGEDWSNTEEMVAIPNGFSGPTGGKTHDSL